MRFETLEIAGFRPILVKLPGGSIAENFPLGKPEKTR